MSLTDNKTAENLIERLFSVGAHFGLLRSRRHPSVKNLIYGVKNKVEIFNLEKTAEHLNAAKAFVSSIASKGGTVLFVGGKKEAQDSIKTKSESVGAPYVAGRWLGGTLTNYSEIKKRISKLEDLMIQKEKGELAKYTKKERLLIDREIEYLNEFFSGLSSMKGLPQALFLIDPKKEIIALKEAKRMNIPTIALMSSDCNIREVDYAIPANDSSKASIEFFVSEIVEAIREGKKNMVNPSSSEVK